MYDLTILKNGDNYVVDSREVAKMVGKDHHNLLRDIHKYANILNAENETSHKSKLISEDFFIRSAYLNERNQYQPCYLLTRKGCDMVANKMTGDKGIRFTATYINKFREMEEDQGLCVEDMIIRQATRMKEVRLKQEEHNRQLKEHELRLNKQEQDQKILQGKVDILNKYEYSIMGFGNMQGYKLTLSQAKILGIKASKLSRDTGSPKHKISDPRFGAVNTYHVEVLNAVFRTHFPNFKEFEIE